MIGAAAAGAIPPALDGRDVLGIAQTGTGKTASFTLPMLSLLAKGRARARMPRSLVLAPTRELAAQVVGVLRAQPQAPHVRAQQQARGHQAPTREAVDAALRAERESWGE